MQNTHITQNYCLLKSYSVSVLVLDRCAQLCNRGYSSPADGWRDKHKLGLSFAKERDAVRCIRLESGQHVPYADALVYDSSSKNAVTSAPNFDLSFDRHCFWAGQTCGMPAARRQRERSHRSYTSENGTSQRQRGQQKMKLRRPAAWCDTTLGRCAVLLPGEWPPNEASLALALTSEKCGPIRSVCERIEVRSITFIYYATRAAGIL